MRHSQADSPLTLVQPAPPFSLPQNIYTELRLTVHLFFLFVTSAGDQWTLKKKKNRVLVSVQVPACRCLIQWFCKQVTEVSLQCFWLRTALHWDPSLPDSLTKNFKEITRTKKMILKRLNGIKWITVKGGLCQGSANDGPGTRSNCCQFL